MKEVDYRETPDRYNKSARTKLRPWESKFAAMNFYTVVEELKAGWASDMANLPSVPEGIPAILIGSGPTSDSIIPLLKDWKGGVFTSTSQASTCMYHKSCKIHIVAYDIQTDVQELSQVDTWKGREAHLLLHPCMKPEFLKYWKGEKSYYLPFMPNCPLREYVLPEMYDFIRSRALMSGSTGGMQLVIARLLGYNPIFMAGLDFGFPFGRDRYTSWYFDHEKNAWCSIEGGKVNREDPEYIEGDNGCPSIKLNVFYKTQFIKMARLNMKDKENPQLLVATPGGLLSSILPNVDVPPAKFIEQQGKGFDHLYRTQEEMVHAYDKYLFQHKCVCIPIPDNNIPGGMGVLPLDTDDWRKETPLFIERQVKTSKTFEEEKGIKPEDIDTNKIMAYFEGLAAELKAEGIEV